MALNKTHTKSSRRRFYGIDRHVRTEFTIDSLVALTCEGEKSAWHANSMCRLDVDAAFDRIYEAQANDFD